jgi:hypothetical protein
MTWWMLTWIIVDSDTTWRIERQEKSLLGDNYIFYIDLTSIFIFFLFIKVKKI